MVLGTKQMKREKKNNLFLFVAFVFVFCITLAMYLLSLPFVFCVASACLFCRLETSGRSEPRINENQTIPEAIGDRRK